MVEGISTIQRRIESHRKEIESIFFDGRELGEILEISGKEADKHRGGQKVMMIRTQAGHFYYKPRDCGTDRFYARLVKSLFSDITRAPALIDCGSYAFFEEIRQEPLRDRAEAESFFFRTGGMLAVFHALGSVDVHKENLVACGSMPVLIDTETILTPVPCREGRKPDGRFLSFPPELAYSTDDTLMLPFRTVVGEQLSLLYNTKGHALPEYEGEILTIRGFEGAFLDGFRTIFLRCIENKDTIRNMLDEAKPFPVRCILRNTMVYELKKAQLLLANEEEKKDRILSTLDRRFLERGAVELLPVSAYEKEALRKGDVPYFITWADSRDLYAEDLTGQPLLTEFFLYSALENARRHLDRLSEEELAFSVSLLKAEFSFAEAHLTPEEERTSWQKIVTEGFPTASAGEKDLLNELLSHAVRFPDGSCGWVTGTTAKPQVCSVNTVWGIAGAGQLLSGMRETEEDPVRRDQMAQIIAGCLQQMERYLEAWDRRADELGQKGCMELAQKDRKEKEAIEKAYHKMKTDRMDQL